MSPRRHSRRGCCSPRSASDNGPERCLCGRERRAAQTGRSAVDLLVASCASVDRVRKGLVGETATVPGVRGAETVRWSIAICDKRSALGGNAASRSRYWRRKTSSTERHGDRLPARATTRCGSSRLYGPRRRGGRFQQRPAARPDAESIVPVPALAAVQIVDGIPYGCACGESQDRFARRGFALLR
jgi:hypothetical protein